MAAAVTSKKAKPVARPRIHLLPAQRGLRMLPTRKVPNRASAGMGKVIAERFPGSFLLTTPACIYGEEEVLMLTVVMIVPPLAGETDTGLKLQVELTGSAEQVRLTAELKPLRLPIVTLNMAVCPALMVIVAGVALMLKSGVGAGVVSGVMRATRIE